MDPNEYQIQQNELNIEVDACLGEIFGAANLDMSPHQRPLLHIGLASHLRHRKSYDALVPNQASTLVKLLPHNSPLRTIPLFTCSRVGALAKYVLIAMPWEDHYCSFKQPTGIPPHSLLLGYMDQIVRAVEQAPQLTGISKGVALVSKGA